MNLKGRVIAIGVTGGIAAYKTCEIVSSLVKAGADVHVVMTKNATEFVSPLTMQTLSNNRVITDMFNLNYEHDVQHVSLGAKAELFVIAPCTANFAAKLANGIADDFLSTTVMACRCPVFIAPAMNTAMLNSAAYIANENLLINRGVNVIRGNSGRLACGDVGEGRMAEPSEILNAIDDFFNVKQDYLGKTVLITAGATSEPIDPVRYITNRSSGKMGAALVENALLRGANVIVVAGCTSVKINNKAKIINVNTTEEMFKAVSENLSSADIIIKAAAPSDYSVEKVSEQKIKSGELILKLKKNPDIAKYVGENKNGKKLIIFSAETENLVANAREKLLKKNADMVVANDVTQSGAGFNSDTNIVTLITKKSETAYEKASKLKVAEIILNKILEL